MDTRSKFFSVHTLLVVTLALATSRSAQVARVPGEIIVRLSSPQQRVAVEAMLASNFCTVIEEDADLDLLLVRAPLVWPTNLVAAQLARMPGIDFAEQNALGQAGGDVVPNDTHYPRQWHHHNTGQFGGTPGADIQSQKGWRLTRGDPSVVVAVLDSGIERLHPEFAGRYLAGRDTVQEDNIPEAIHPHGPWVTGLLAANADNAFSVAGVDHGCTILPVRVLNGLFGTTFDLVQGLNFATNAGADLISMSLINYPADQALRMALNRARDAGVILLACAGNGGFGDADVSWPGASGRTISIGATTRNDTRAFFSGTGSRLDLVAPGEIVPTIVWGSSNDSSSLFSGCSAATPVAAGIASLALSIEPTLTHPQMRALLIAGAEDQVGRPSEDTPGRDDFHGHGRMNLLLTLCGLDKRAPDVLGPGSASFECTSTGGVAGDDPQVTALLAAMSADDDLDPEPTLRTDAPAFLPMGSNQLVFTAADVCGKETNWVVDVTVADTFEPTLTVGVGTNQLWPPNGRMVVVDLQAGTTDVCDPDPAIDVRVHSDEVGKHASAAANPAPGTLGLRAARNGKGDGRVYLIEVSSTDASGNVALDCVTVVVPHDQSPAARAAVLQEAAAARTTFLATGAPPPGFDEVPSTSGSPKPRSGPGRSRRR